MGIYVGSLIGLLLIACAILFAGRAFASDNIRGPLLDALTGVAVAYAFIDVFPHLASMQSKLELDYVSGVFAYLAHHVYLMALLGFIVYLGVKNSLLEDAEADRHAHSRRLVLVSSFCIYTFLIGYMLSEQPTHRLEPSILFAIAMAAHLLGLNYENRRLNPSAYDQYFRFLLVASVIAGWLVGVFFEMSDAAYALWFAYLAGGIVSAGVATELPRVKTRGAFISFVIGAILFSALILLSEAYRL
jgi:hypothetical protein